MKLSTRPRAARPPRSKVRAVRGGADDEAVADAVGAGAVSSVRQSNAAINSPFPHRFLRTSARTGA